MAKRNSMSTARRSRNLEQEPITRSNATTASPSGDGLAPEPPRQTSPADLAEIISDERARLMKAQAVLACVAFALLYEDWLEGPNRPSFADAIAAVQDLVEEAVERLGFELTRTSL